MKKLHMTREFGHFLAEDCNFGVAASWDNPECSPILPHDHDYYEIFLVTDGRVMHRFGKDCSEKQLLEKGDMLFVRDVHIHGFDRLEGVRYNAFNLAVSTKVAKSALRYLGGPFEARCLLEAEKPAFAHADERNLGGYIEVLRRINQRRPVAPWQAERELRVLFIRILAEVFLNADPVETDDIPKWLTETCLQMSRIENSLGGVKRMTELSKKSPGHLALCMKKYFNTTPTEFINSVRIGAAENKLINTDMPVTDICCECGFDNISWFYKSFRRKNGITPLEYREKHGRAD